MSNSPESGSERDARGRRVIVAEIVKPDSPPDSGQDAREAYERTDNRAFRGAYYGNAGGMSLGRVWGAPLADRGGCAAPCATFSIFLICLVQYGLLAAIGFLVFHAIGAVAGAIAAARQLALGIARNPWGWRIGNWLVSFLLTSWLAGR